jgi:hypothetical protein
MRGVTTHAPRRRVERSAYAVQAAVAAALASDPEWQEF